MHTSLFHLSDEPFIEPETVISVFKREDGEIFAQCADMLEGFSSAMSNAFDDNVLSSEARLFAYNYAIKELGFYAPLMPAEDCGKLIIDTVYDYELNTVSSNRAVRLTGKEIYPKELEDIKLGAENGYDCYGVLEGKTVVSAAYTFLSHGDIEGEIEIGVETVSQYRGRGYAADCVAALSEYLYNEKVSVIYSYYEHNIASAALAEKCGFHVFAKGYEITLERSDKNAL